MSLEEVGQMFDGSRSSQNLKDEEAVERTEKDGVEVIVKTLSVE